MYRYPADCNWFSSRNGSRCRKYGPAGEGSCQDLGDDSLQALDDWQHGRRQRLREDAVGADNTYDQVYVSNYGLLNVRDVLARIEGVGSVNMFGAREYAMRIWLDPERISMLGMTAEEVLLALRQQNVQVAGGQIGEPPIKRPGPSKSRCNSGDASRMRRNSGRSS